MKKVYVPKDPHEKAMQRALMQYALPRNRALVTEALHLAGREDLIGYGPQCLVKPEGGRDGNRRAQPVRKPGNAGQVHGGSKHRKPERGKGDCGKSRRVGSEPGKAAYRKTERKEKKGPGRSRSGVTR